VTRPPIGRAWFLQAWFLRAPFVHALLAASAVAALGGLAPAAGQASGKGGAAFGENPVHIRASGPQQPVPAGGAFAVAHGTSSPSPSTGTPPHARRRRSRTFPCVAGLSASSRRTSSRSPQPYSPSC